MNKDQVRALIEDLPDEFDADKLAYILTLRQRLDRAEADLAAGWLRSNPGEPPTPWEQWRSSVSAALAARRHEV